MSILDWIGTAERIERKYNSFDYYVRWCEPGQHWFKTKGKTRGKRVCQKHRNNWWRNKGCKK